MHGCSWLFSGACRVRLHVVGAESFGWRAWAPSERGSANRLDLEDDQGRTDEGEGATDQVEQRVVFDTFCGADRDDGGCQDGCESAGDLLRELDDGHVST